METDVFLAPMTAIVQQFQVAQPTSTVVLSSAAIKRRIVPSSACSM